MVVRSQPSNLRADVIVWQLIVWWLAGLLISPPVSAAVVKRSQMHMGTLVWVTAVAPDNTTAQRAAALALEEIKRLDQLLSTWIPTSEISRINAAAGRSPVHVSPETMEVLSSSLEIARLTDGAFNICVGPAVRAWDINAGGRIPSKDELEHLRPLVDLSQVILDHQLQTVFLAHPGMEVDIGGIGKGFAADRAVLAMQEAGATAGVVALSGDIKTFGRLPGGERFVFGIQHPRREPGRLLARLELENEAVSTAGDYQRYFIQHGIRYHHILDPATLRPARLTQSVTIIASEGTVADGLDTGIFVLGPTKGMALIEQLPEVEGVIVGHDGAVYVSTGLQNRLQLEPDIAPAYLAP
ncbi:MAG: FAD:protein FMN transferase [Nitrospirae bacterium]|nr:MAG: FAD:protein FMN transferase [Nitrospirota bacterium]